MKRRIVILSIVLGLAALLLIGCTAKAAGIGETQQANAGTGTQQGNGDGQNRNADGQGSGTGQRANGANQQGQGNGTGQQAKAGTGNELCPQDGAGTQQGNGPGQGNNTGQQGNGAGQQGNGAQNGNNGDCTSGSGDCAEPATSQIPDSDTSAGEDTTGYGAEGALEDTDLTLSDMLTYAIQDEYLARAEYTYIIGTYGDINVFVNILGAEETHIEELTPLFAAYGIDIPQDTASDNIVSAGSLTDAYEAGETAEINNIAMYDRFLTQDLPQDVRKVFLSLRSASEKHLTAFQKHL